MKNIIKTITHTDNDEIFINKKNRLCKSIEVTFNETKTIEIIKVKLVNVEIDVEMADEYNEDGTLDRKDAYIPVELKEIEEHSDTPIKTEKLILYFENGQTMFNDGAEFLISLKEENKNEILTYVYELKNDTWSLIEDCDEIEIKTKYKEYQLINAEWEEIERCNNE